MSSNPRQRPHNTRTQPVRERRVARQSPAQLSLSFGDAATNRTPGETLNARTRADEWPNLEHPRRPSTPTASRLRQPGPGPTSSASHETPAGFVPQSPATPLPTAHQLPSPQHAEPFGQQLPFDRHDAPRPSPQLSHGRIRQVVVGEHTISFTLRRSRRRTIGFLINDDGLRVSAPRWVSLAQIEDAVRQRAHWILTRMHAWRERQRRIAAQRTNWVDGGTLPYLGVTIIMRLDGSKDTQFSGIAEAPSENDTLWLSLPADATGDRIRDVVQAWLQQQAHAIIGARLNAFLQRTGLRINRWRLSSARTRWGSCSSRGNIMLNWRLIHFPLPIIDYVIAHELAHLREMNHGPGFWSEVSRLHPDYQQAREVLRQHSPTSLPTY